jgi:hypothetical protein
VLVWGLESGFQGLGFRVWDLGVRDHDMGLGAEVSSLGFRV